LLHLTNPRGRRCAQEERQGHTGPWPGAISIATTFPSRSIQLAHPRILGWELEGLEIPAQLIEERLPARVQRQLPEQREPAPPEAPAEVGHEGEPVGLVLKDGVRRGVGDGDPASAWAKRCRSGTIPWRRG
jgi:hypothetical protein